MGIRSEKLEEGISIVLEKIKRDRKVTLSSLSKDLEFTIGKVQKIVQHLLQRNEIQETLYPDYITRKFKVYYSIEPLNLPNSVPSQSSHISSCEVPEYYKFLDRLFGTILSSDKMEVLMEFLEDMEVSVEDIMRLQEESRRNE